LFGSGDPDVTQYDYVPLPCRFFKKRHLVPDGIGKDGLEDKTLPALQELATERIGHLCRLVRRQTELAGDYVGINKADSGRC
jgi:hypothetical protein